MVGRVRGGSSRGEGPRVGSEPSKTYHNCTIKLQWFDQI